VGDLGLWLKPGLGPTWSVVPTPNGSPDTNYLSGVTCTNPNYCIAVGEYQPPLGSIQTLIESWNGTSWSLTSPNAGLLDGVSCTTSGVIRGHRLLRCGGLYRGSF